MSESCMAYPCRTLLTYISISRERDGTMSNQICRARVWNAIRRTMQTYQCGNTAAWCGDLNVSGRMFMPHLVRTSIRQPPEKVQNDEIELHGMFGLRMLNTWPSPQTTCTTSGHISQVDFIITRIQQADAQQEKASHCMRQWQVQGAWQPTDAIQCGLSSIQQALNNPATTEYQQTTNIKPKQDAIAKNMPQAQQLQLKLDIEARLQTLPSNMDSSTSAQESDKILLKGFPAWWRTG